MFAGQGTQAFSATGSSSWDQESQDRQHSTSQQANTSLTSGQQSSSAGSHKFAKDERIIIKVRLGNDVRKLPLLNDDMNYDDLLIMMQRVFKGKLNSNDQVIVKYKDEDGDLITIADDADFTFALQQTNKVLKAELFLNGAGDTNGVLQKDDVSSHGWQDAFHQLHEKLTGLPSSINDGLHAVVEKVLNDRQSSSSGQDPLALTQRTDNKSSNAIQPPKEQNSIKSPGSALLENGAFQELSLKDSSDGRRDSEVSSISQHTGQSSSQAHTPFQQNLHLQQNGSAGHDHHGLQKPSHQQQHPQQPPQSQMSSQLGQHGTQQQQQQTQPSHLHQQQQQPLQGLQASQQLQQHPGLSQHQQPPQPGQYAQHPGQSAFPGHPGQAASQPGLGSAGLKAQYSFPPTPAGTSLPGSIPSAGQPGQFMAQQQPQFPGAAPPRAATPGQQPTATSQMPVGPPPPGMGGQFTAPGVNLYARPPGPTGGHMMAQNTFGMQSQGSAMGQPPQQQPSQQQAGGTQAYPGMYQQPGQGQMGQQAQYNAYGAPPR